MVLEQISTSDELRAIAQQHKWVLLDFTSKRCGPCKMLAPKLEQFQEQYSQVKFYKIDTDDINTDLVERFQIEALPTVFILEDGTAIEQIVGLQVKAVQEALERIIAKNETE